MTNIDPRYYYLTLGLLGLCTVVGLFVAFRLQRDVSVEDVPPTEKEVLGPLEKAYYSGLMTEEEFKRIGHSMAKQKDGPLPLVKPLKKPPMTLAEATGTAEVPPEPSTEENAPPSADE